MVGYSGGITPQHFFICFPLFHFCHDRVYMKMMADRVRLFIQNSKFLQFVSKMSRGELTIDDNQVKQTAPSSGDWATEYQQHYGDGPAWADEFVRNTLCIV